MKPPITDQTSVVIHVRQKDCEHFIAEIPSAKIRATSTCGPEAAAHNAAKRFFWGGTTRKFVGLEETLALHLSQRGPSPTCFVAWITKGGSQ